MGAPESSTGNGEKQRIGPAETEGGPANWQRHLPAGLVALGPEGSPPSLPAMWVSAWAKDPSKPILFDASAGRWVAAGEVESLTRRLAGTLAACGVAAGDRVAYSLRDPFTLSAWHIAVLRLGAVSVPANPDYSLRELAHVITVSGASVIVLDDPGKANQIEALPSPRPSVLVHGTEYPRPLDCVLDRASPHEGALLAFTSGTTGSPKGALLSHGNLVAGIRALTEAWRWDGDDVLVLALPLYHMHGLGVGLHGTLATGSSAVLQGRFDAGAVLGAVREHRATLFFGVPTMYTRLVRHPDACTLGRLRLAVSGSAPLSTDAFHAYEAVSGSRILERYGMTETMMLLSNPYEGERRPGSVGFELPGVEARFVPYDESGLSAACADAREPRADARGPRADARGPRADARGPGAAEQGEIEVRGPNVFSGYWHDAVATREAFSAGGWFKTGDIGIRDTDGYVTLVGRNRDLIITGGYNVYPREIENVLGQCPGVAEAAVVGLPSPEWGEEVVALVVVDAGAGAGKVPGRISQEIARHCSERLAPYKRPRIVHMVDALPRNALGKVPPGALRALAESLRPG